jgi:hypothetical protein
MGSGDRDRDAHPTVGEALEHRTETGRVNEDGALVWAQLVGLQRLDRLPQEANVEVVVALDTRQDTLKILYHGGATVTPNTWVRLLSDMPAFFLVRCGLARPPDIAPPTL